MSITAHHAEWLTLVPHSGPFLSVGVLTEAFPDGLGTVDPKRVAELRAAYGTWSDPEGSDYEDVESSELHEAFILFVLRELLGLDEEVLLCDPEVLDRYAVSLEVHDIRLRPDGVVTYRDRVRMLVSWVERTHVVDQPLPGDAWAASPRERMVEHLRETGCPLGLVTDGERWTLVSWREGEAPGFATWWAWLWFEEHITLRAFTSLLGEHRFFSVPEEDTLAGLLRRSAEDQSRVTTKLGSQTLEAVQILIQTLDKLDRDRGGKLLNPVDEQDLYDAAVTVMMRLIFLFYAEENELLPVGEDLYLERYAASTLRAQLQADADLHGEEVLETRGDAWPRLLATWRAVFAGVEHHSMPLAPYGGSLFDPDRYPFLEGRLPGSSWREEPANPLPVDNRTVLHLLNALQTLEERGHRRKLSFLALDVEQIGHVYEGMLDHTAARAGSWVLGFSGVSGAEPEISLQELEKLDEEKLLDLLKDRTNRGASTNRRWLKEDPDEVVEKEFGLLWAPPFEGDDDAAQRTKQFAKFLRKDSHGAPAVFPPGSAYVCDSSHRGATGTHYTPRALTEGIVRETLEPLVYHGPAEGLSEDEWRLRSPREILDLKVADPACGSGAFLVQACRYLAEKLTESRREHGDLDRDATEEDLVRARREIAARCLYGVDKNPMAVEMAKLSLWLVTLAEDRPFSFVDHALGVGDSLFGLHDLDQLRYWNLAGEGAEQGLFVALVEDKLERAIKLRKDVEAFPVVDHEDAVLKGVLLEDAEAATRKVRALADLLFAPSLASEKQSEIDELRSKLLLEATDRLDDPSWLHQRARRVEGFVEPLHWALVFPEVFERGGFDAIAGNPPFLGGKRISTELGWTYREHLVNDVALGARGSADLVAYFFLRVYALLRSGGFAGLLAVNTIAEGDTRRVALESLLDRGATIYSAHPNEPWPNQASVVTSRIQMRKDRSWHGTTLLDDHPVDYVSGFLSDQRDYSPERLAGSANVAFYGSVVSGSGFLVDPRVGIELIRSDPKYEQVVVPFLNGRDLNQDPQQEPSRWVICFWDWPEERARQFPRAFEIVEELVKPARAAKPDQRTQYRDWWLFARSVPGLYHAVGRGNSFNSHPDGWDQGRSKLDRVICNAQTTKYWGPTFVPNTALFSSAVSVFASDSPSFLALLLSCVHAEWAWKQKSTLETRLRYTPSDCFETFPLPEHGKLPEDGKLRRLGSEYHELRKGMMLREQIGLTDLYNRLHDPEDASADMDRLRELQVAMDRRSLELYGWEDLELEHDFREVSYLPPNDNMRFAISEEARLELLDRLGRLNLERYEQEVEQGLHGRKARKELEKKKGTGKERGHPAATREASGGERSSSRQTDPNQADIFDTDELRD